MTIWLFNLHPKDCSYSCEINPILECWDYLYASVIRVIAPNSSFWIPSCSLWTACQDMTWTSFISGCSFWMRLLIQLCMCSVPYMTAVTACQYINAATMWIAAKCSNWACIDCVPYNCVHNEYDLYLCVLFIINIILRILYLSGSHDWVSNCVLMAYIFQCYIFLHISLTVDSVMPAYNYPAWTLRLRCVLNIYTWFHKYMTVCKWTWTAYMNSVCIHMFHAQRIGVAMLSAAFSSCWLLLQSRQCQDVDCCFSQDCVFIIMPQRSILLCFTIVPQLPRLHAACCSTLFLLGLCYEIVSLPVAAYTVTTFRVSSIAVFRSRSLCYSN